MLLLSTGKTIFPSALFELSQSRRNFNFLPPRPVQLVAHIGDRNTPVGAESTATTSTTDVPTEEN